MKVRDLIVQLQNFGNPDLEIYASTNDETLVGAGGPVLLLGFGDVSQERGKVSREGSHLVFEIAEGPGTVKIAALNVAAFHADQP